MSQAPAFDRRAAAAAADAKLGEALRFTTGRLQAGRAAALAELPDADALRDHARSVRAHTLRHLGRYLDQFAVQVEALGGTVHWATTAADAVAVVVEIATRRAARLVVKSKSMLSEEIELNHALEQAGIRVVETDLGEFIVQLARDRPSHIITPIVHWTREDVAVLFRQRLGAAEQDVADIPAMTALARRLLRREFLAADIGVSGVNFGVAATGSIVTVTNEGNGRLTTTTPPLHVALMGIERIVPTVDDLEVMLRLLARSATGQKLSVYTNIVTGPRRDGEVDGPRELHVVLVDNGRSTLLAGELAEILYCIRCGACLNICPVYQRVGGHTYDSVYPGPLGSVLTPGLHGLAAAPDLPQASTLCGACRDVCPVRIDIPRMLVALRTSSVQQGLGPGWIRLGVKAHAWLASRPRAYRAALRAVGVASAPLARQGWMARLPWPLSGWTAHRDFPAPARRPFSALWAERRRAR